jgi:sensor histidine kinase YesM
MGNQLTGVNPLIKIGRIAIISWLFLVACFYSYSDELDSLLLNSYGNIETSVFETTDKSLTAANILDSVPQNKFSPLNNDKTLLHRKTYWFKLDFYGIDLSKSDQWIIRFAKYDWITLYFSDAGTLKPIRSGKLVRNRTADPYFAVDFRIPKSGLIEGRYLLVRVEHVYRKMLFRQPVYMSPLIADLDGTYFTIKDLYDLMPYVLFIGGMLLMIFYSFGIYFMNRDRLFNYYAVYLLTLLLYLGVRMPVLFGKLEVHFPLFMGVYNDVIQVLVNITYLLFAAYFLNARTDFPKLHIAIRYAVWVLAGVIALQLILLLTESLAWIGHYLLQAERYFMIVFSLVAYAHILLNYKNRIVYFLLIGSLVFLSGGVVAMFFHDIKYMMMGAIAEVFIFSLGMGYRIRQVEQAKQTIEIEISKIRLTALRAQMNPHFIFNSLNSIRAYVITNNIPKASDYLNKFARLIRLILHYSSKDTVSLKEELDTLKLYIELEQMRYRDDFGFELSIGSDVDTGTWKVPPLILQPYVENAIGHGLAPKKGDKKLEVNVTKNEKRLSFVIRDNGVGRSFSRKSHQQRDPRYKSVAMELTRKRIELAETDHSGNGKIDVVDLTNNGKPSGTEVRLNLPLQS